MFACLSFYVFWISRTLCTLKMKRTYKKDNYLQKTLSRLTVLIFWLIHTNFLRIMTLIYLLHLQAYNFLQYRSAIMLVQTPSPYCELFCFILVHYKGVCLVMLVKSQQHFLWLNWTGCYASWTKDFEEERVNNWQKYLGFQKILVKFSICNQEAIKSSMQPDMQTLDD